MHPVTEPSVIEHALIVFDRLVATAEQIERKSPGETGRSAAYFRGEAAGYRYAAAELRKEFLDIARRRRDPLKDGVFAGTVDGYVLVEAGSLGD